MKSQGKKKMNYEIAFNDRIVKITHPEKVLFPEVNITKHQLPLAVVKNDL